MLFEIRNLEYIFNNFRILKSKSFFIEKNKHFLILGPSGSGKTTLLNLMSGLLRTSSGSIYFKKKNYSHLSEEELDDLRSKNFGFIFQKLHLIGHLNVEQNIILAQTKRNYKNIDKLINNLNLDNKKKQKASDLSFGEAQRVAIARGLANNPQVIFADEPTSGLDDINTKKVINLIFSQVKKNNYTLIVSTHDDRIKNYFSNILKLSI